MKSTYSNTYDIKD